MSRFDRLVRERKHGINHVTSQHADKVAYTENNEASSNAEQDNGEGQIKAEVLPAVIPQDVVDANAIKATEITENQTEQAHPSRKWLPRIRTKPLLVFFNMLVAFAALYASYQNSKLIAVNDQLAQSARIQADASASQATLMQDQLQIMRETLDQTLSSSKESSEQSNRLIATNQKLADASLKSSDIAEQAMVFSTRPIVGIQGIELDMETGKITMAVVNVGKNPARNFIMTVRLRRFKIDHPQSDVSKHYKYGADESQLFPGIIPLKIDFALENFTPELATRLRNWKEILVITGHFRYGDGFGHTNDWAFRFFYDPRQGWIAMPITLGE